MRVYIHSGAGIELCIYPELPTFGEVSIDVSPQKACTLILTFVSLIHARISGELGVFGRCAAAMFKCEDGQTPVETTHRIIDRDLSVVGVRGTVE